MTHDRTQQQGQTGPQVFICYAREDYAIAERLYHDLQRAGVKPWLDEEVLLPGQNWKRMIKQAMKQSSYILALLSSHSVSKTGYVQKELKEALDLLDQQAPSKIFIIPVRIDECEPDDERLQELHWVNLFSDYKEGLRQILGVLLPDSTPRPPRLQLKILRLIGVLILLFIGAFFLGGIIIQMITPAPTPTAIPTPTATLTATPTPNPPTPTPVPVLQLRSKPLAVSSDKAQQEFDLTTRNFGWGTSDWAPRTYLDNQYEDRGNVVVDHATGLMWQKSGSDTSLTYNDAEEYVKKLNRQKLAGYDDWRLPTIPELMSLLEPEKQSNGLYIDPIFKTHEYEWCWSSDRLSEGGSSSAAWYVYFDFGNVYLGLLDPEVYVRAVRS